MNHDPKAGYRAALERLDALVASLTHPPRFALPPVEIFVIAHLADVGHKLARNASAHALIDAIGDRADGPTLAMLDATLTMRGIEVERVSLGELGLDVGVG